MFWPALFAVVLISSTIESLSARKLRTNCTSFLTAKTKPAHYTRKDENLVCFRTKNASEHVHIRAIVYPPRFPLIDYSWKRQCYAQYVHVFDDCNLHSYSEKRLDCKIGHHGEMFWSSNNSNCLKVYLYDSRKFNERINLSITYSNQANLGAPGRSSKRPSKPQVPRTIPPKCKDLYFENDRGTIQSPNYPKKYAPNQDCTYKIEIPSKNIQLIFRDVELEKGNRTNECKDYIEVYGGIASWSTVIHKFCDKKLVNSPIRLSGNKVKIRFVTDGHNNFGGFNASYGPYQMVTGTLSTTFSSCIIKDVTHKVTGVVIGTACGLVFLALTSLAICHFRSRIITLLHFVRRRYDISNSDDPDAIL